MIAKRRLASAAALAIALAVTGTPSAAAAAAAAASPLLRIVPAVSYGAAEPDPATRSPAPRRRSPLAWYRHECPPGGIVVVYAPEPRGSFPTALLDAQSRAVSRGTSFRWGAGWLSLVAVPATVRPGSYDLWIPDIRVPVRVTDRKFAFEAIPLSGALTALRTQPDPRKAEEAAELVHLLASADPGARYETGALALPLAKARRTAGYGDRREYRYEGGGSDLSVHGGLDLALPEGTPVAASGRGRVVMAKERVVTGWTVVIEHLPGLYSLYFHMSGACVGVGDLVEKGQRIGSLGMTGLATGPHLHWEVQVGGAAVDPDLLTGGMPFAPGSWPIPPAPPAVPHAGADQAGAAEPPAE